MRYFLKLAYNGSLFHGWQMQENAISVQQNITENLSRILTDETPITGCGRTDAGVHAKQFYAHFDASLKISRQSLVHRLNTMTHRNIVIFDLLKVKDGAHARYDAIERNYEYVMTTRKNPFLLNMAYRFNYQLDLDAMNSACKLLLGEKDFGCFRKARSNSATDLCRITKAEWTEDGDLLRFNITANRFLRNMVRAIVGTLLEIGRGEKSADSLRTILVSRQRSQAGFSVPAHGLYLKQVTYPSETFITAK